MRALASLALPLLAAATLPACLLEGDGPDEPVPPDVTSGTYRHYAQSSWTLPATSEDARRYGFDFDGDRTIDNQAGAVIAALDNIGLDVQTASDTAITAGELVILHSVRADELTDDGSVSWRVLSGRPTTPPRWDGTDDFIVAGEDGSFVGPIVRQNARLDWGVINVTLPFFPDQAPTILPLADARIDARITDDGCEGTIGGVMLAADIDVTLRRFAAQAITHIERHPEHELARVAYQVFDTNRDGVITVAEMVSNSITQSLFSPDLDLDGRAGNDALSFGLGFSCEAARFSAPGEI
ncbi:MAG TPA: hypothetical protein VM261_10750 [Kofleriaceae bacterium]|nr:hypothetical protein [Kofleriaceae bacterium]